MRQILYFFPNRTIFKRVIASLLIINLLFSIFAPTVVSVSDTRSRALQEPAQIPTPNHGTSQDTSHGLHDSDNSEQTDITQLSYNEERQEFTVRMNIAVGDVKKITYRMYYRTTDGRTDGIHGSLENRAGSAVAIPAKTCSGGDCIGHEVSHGVLKVGIAQDNEDESYNSDENLDNGRAIVRYFLTDGDRFVISNEKYQETLGLSDFDNLFMEHPAVDLFDNAPTIDFDGLKFLFDEDATNSANGDAELDEIPDGAGIYPRKKRWLWFGGRRYTHKDRVQEDEIVEMRTENAKAYTVTDEKEVTQAENDYAEEMKEQGLETLDDTELIRHEYYLAPVHFQDGNSYKEIDNTIVVDETGYYTYRNAAHAFTFRAGENVESGVEFTSPEGNICRFGLDTADGVAVANVKAEIEENVIRYPGIYENADLEFTVTSEGVKTEIVAKSKDALKDEYEFTLFQCDEVSFQDAVMADDDTVASVTEEIAEEPEEVIVVTDEGKEEEATATVEKIILKPDYSQLGEIKGEVRIDPTVPVGNRSQRTYIAPGMNHTNVYHPAYTIGNYAGVQNGIGLFRFDLSDYGNHGIDILGGTLKLHVLDTNGDTYVRIRRINQPWDMYNTVYPGPSLAGDRGIRGVSEDNHGKMLRTVQIPHDLLIDLKNDGYGSYGFALDTVNQGGFQYCAGNHNYSGRFGSCYTHWSHDWWHKSPSLTVYSYKNRQNPNRNRPPSIPDQRMPRNGQWIPHQSGQRCDESVSPRRGACRTRTLVAMVAESGDPDGWGHGDILYQQFQVVGTNNLLHNMVGTSEVTYYANMYDGISHWRTRAVDRTNRSSDWTPYRWFVTDTTPPGVSRLNPLPEYYNRTSLDLVGVVVGDNVFDTHDTQYRLRYSKTPDFWRSYVSGWQRNNVRFQLGPHGMDQRAGTEDDIESGSTYYFQIGTSDLMGNIAAWSAPVAVTIDTEAPVISDLSFSEKRFSPHGETSIGVKDTTEARFTYTEDNPREMTLQVRSSDDTVVYESTIDESGKTKAVNEPVSISWNGTTTTGEPVPDGAYTMQVKMIDKAGNVNEYRSDTPVIVDNTPAEILISSPFTGYWTAADQVVITGQIPLGDVATCEIQRSGIDLWQSFDCSALAQIFSVTQPLAPGENTFTLRSTDLAGNVATTPVTVYHEDTPPQVSVTTPEEGATNSARLIAVTLEETGETRSGVSTLPEENNLDITLSYTLGTADPVKKALLTDGVIVDTDLVSSAECSVAGGSSDSTNPLVPAIPGLQPAGYAQVDCAILLSANLQPDAEYTVSVSATDIAGARGSAEQSFVVDTQLFHQVEAVKNGSIYSTSTPLYQGTASKNSTLTFENTTLGRSKTVLLNEALNGTGADSTDDPDHLITEDFTVTCGSFEDVDGNAATPAEEVCTWQTRVLQSFVLDDTDTSNTTVITASDTAGNSKTETRTYIVNLYGYTIEIDTDRVYFSPNGDGNLDGINFAHSIQPIVDEEHPLDPLNPPQIDTWDLKLKQVRNAGGEQVSEPDNWNNGVVRVISGTNLLPYHSYFDGTTDGNYLYVSDGTYLYELSITTTDGISKTVPHPKNTLYAKTKVTDEVVIASPKDGHVTTRGVLTIQGQAPAPEGYDAELFQGTVTVDLCLKDIAESGGGACTLTESVQVDENGFYSRIVALPQLAEGEQATYRISASARDEYGNTTDKSNVVQLVYDTVDPGVSVRIAPALTGINSREEYERFVNGDIAIDDLRSVFITATVSENTQKMQLDFAEYTNLEEGTVGTGSGEVRKHYIGLYTNQPEPDERFNPGLSDTVKLNHGRTQQKGLNDDIPFQNCDQATGCTWGTYLPTQPTQGGLYEVTYTFQKGETVQTMSAGFTVDNSIPAAPVVMLLDKWEDTSSDGQGNWKTMTSYRNAYYTNTDRIRLRGAAEPESWLELLLNGEPVGLKEPGSDEYRPFIKIDKSGVWEAELNIADLVEGSSEKTLEITPVAFEQDEENTRYYEVESPFATTVIYDTIAPRITDVNMQVIGQQNVSPWGRYGNYATLAIRSSEVLDAASVVKEDGYAGILSGDASGMVWNGLITLTALTEGYYDVDVYTTDLAGNVGMQHSKEFSTDNLPDYRIKIDHTPPALFGWNWETWGYQVGGKDAGESKTDVYIGRLNRGYVTRSREVELTGWGEKGQRAQFYVNGKPHGTPVTIGAENCHVPDNRETEWSLSGTPVPTTTLTPAPYASPTQEASGSGTLDDELPASGSGDIATEEATIVTEPDAGNIEHAREDKVTEDGLTVYHATQCNVSTTFMFEGDGSHPKTGEPSEGYYVEMKVLDNSGNTSNTSRELIIYHDTQKPEKPVIHQKESAVNARVERYADVEFVMYAPDGTETNRLHTWADRDGYTGNFPLLFTDQWGTYKVEVVSWDAAGNESEKVVEEIDRVMPAVGGGIFGGFGYDFSKVTLFVDVTDYGTYNIRGYQIPAPILSSAEEQNGTTEITGSSIAKNHPIQVHARYTYITPTLCLVSGTCSLGHPLSETVETTVDHALVSVHKQDGSQVAYNWQEGNRSFKHSVQGLNIGQKVKARTTIYGDFEYNGIKIDYRGVNAASARDNRGLQSVWGNEVQVKKYDPMSIFQDAVSPVSHESCVSYVTTSEFGFRDIGNGKEFHTGIDLAIDGGCIIVSVADGNSVQSSGYNYGYGNTVLVTHNSYVSSRYSHGKHFIGSGGEVKKGQEILYMGSTGRSQADHLDFEVYLGGKPVNPRNHFNFKECIDRSAGCSLSFVE